MHALGTLVGVFLVATTAQQPGPGDWKPFSPGAGGFKVLLPAKPQEKARTVDTAKGPVTVRQFVVEGKEVGGKLVIAVSESGDGKDSAESLQKRLDVACTEILAQAGGKLVAEKKVALDKHPGRELHVEVEGRAAIRIQLFAVGRRLYQLMAVGTR